MIRAYPRHASMVAGEDLQLHVSTDAPRFRVVCYRYGEHYERMGDPSPWLAGVQAQPRGPGIAWDWPAYTIATPLRPRSGAYIAALDDGSSLSCASVENGLDSRSARALFAVRSADSPAQLLVVLPLFTYHAYNVADIDGTLGEDEGECLYSGAQWVSLHRPGGGIGGHPWDEVNVDSYDRRSPRQTFAHWDAKALAWLDSRGYAYDCCTDLELHDPLFDLQRYRAIASFGHHEYWTQRMRDRVDAYVRSGGNVAVFGGNTCWFRAEYDEQRQCIRRAGRWIDRPEWKTTGVSYACGGGKWIGERPPSGYRVRNAAHWIFAGSGMRNGDEFGFAERLVGYECDGVHEDSDLDVLADGSIARWPVGDGSGELTPNSCASLGVRTDNGTVFTASTVDWARVLHAENPVVERITANVLDHFLVRP